MFTGLIEQVGQIRSLQNRGDGLNLTIEAHFILPDVVVGDSLAVDGVCLTVVHCTKSKFSVDVVGETLSRSTLGEKSVGDKVNLERALKVSDRFGGHFVQGHVDGLAQIVTIETRDQGYWINVRMPDHLLPFTVEKGSITLDGISLTIAHLDDQHLSVAVIPHTWDATTLKYKHVGDSFNVEADILAKYVKKFMQPYEKSPTLTWDKLAEYGF